MPGMEWNVVATVTIAVIKYSAIRNKSQLNQHAKCVVWLMSSAAWTPRNLKLWTASHFLTFNADDGCYVSDLQLLCSPGLQLLYLFTSGFLVDVKDFADHGGVVCNLLLESCMDLQSYVKRECRGFSAVFGRMLTYAHCSWFTVRKFWGKTAQVCVNAQVV